MEEISRAVPTYLGELTACGAAGRAPETNRGAAVHGATRAAFAGLLLFGLAGIAAAQEPGALQLELNKLEPREAGCRAYFVVGNTGERAYEELQLDLIFFGMDGIIARRLAVDAGPLRAAKTSVKLFDIAGLACADIGGVLVNDVLACRSGTESLPDCIAAIVPKSRLSVSLMK